MAKQVLFRGCGTALVTPFTPDGVDYPAMGQLIDWQIEQGIDALIILGTTGEPSTMTGAEKEAVLAFAIKRVAGRVPVIAGTGGNDTRRVIADSLKAQALGANGLLVVTPYYNKTTQHGLVAHYTAVADAVDMPIIIYNVPSRTGLNMVPGTLAQLAKHPNIVAMKEASANIEQITEMFRLCHEDMAIYSGNDDHIVPFLGLGGEGVISVLSNVAPQQTHEMVAAFHQGDLARSRALQFALNPLNKQLFCEVNPVPVKAALGMMGICQSTVRLPLTNMLPENEANLRAAMQGAGLI